MELLQCMSLEIAWHAKYGTYAVSYQPLV